MNQKWKLQDIQPPNRPRKSAGRVRAKVQQPETDQTTDQEINVEVHTEDRPSEPRARDIKPQRPVRRAPAEPRQEPASEESHFDTIEIVDGARSRTTSYIIAGAVFVLVLLGAVVASALMGGAEVTVQPKHEQKAVSANFIGSIVPQQDTVTYELLTLEANGERQVEATGQEEVSEQAMGTIFIYNSFSTSPVRLVKNTRFEAPGGLIYKISESAVVPGYSTDDSGEIVPGVVAADVFAEAPGEQYNIGPSSFTIPGFKGFPEYDKVVGESTSGMIGGFSGQKFIIDEAELETARQALHTELRDALLDRLPNERPAGFVVYDDAVTFTFNSLPAVAYGDNLATIKEQGVLRVPIFKESDLAKFLANKSISGYDGLPVRLDDYNALSFSYLSPTTTISDISSETELNFSLNGDIHVIWEFDENELKADLLGTDKNKEAVSKVVEQHPAIQEIEAVVRPFWKTTFPREMREIEIIENIE